VNYPQGVVGRKSVTSTFVVGVVLWLGTATTAKAQAPRSDGDTGAGMTGYAAETARTVTAAEEEYGGSTLYPQTGLPRASGERRVPREQLDTLLHQRAPEWVKGISTNTVQGIQHDPMGALAVMAGEDEVAKRQFAARLAQPSLSVHDRAYTLAVATVSFGANASDSVRMRTALAYLAKLDALPASASQEKFFAHGRIGRSYYMIGDGGRAAAYIAKAFTFIPEIPFGMREWMQNDLSPIVYLPLLANVWSAMPGGRARIDSVGRWLTPYARATPEQLAHDTQDSAYHRLTETNDGMLQLTLRMLEKLGRPAPAITANYWVNAPVPHARSEDAPNSLLKTLGDGKIRILEYGHFGCLGCVLALPKLDKLRERLPANTETMYVTFGSGSWGATPCTPDEEAKHLTHFYTIQKKIKMPIALWIGERQKKVDGGTAQEGSPSFRAYPLVGYPWFIVTDGKGIVRTMMMGYDEALLHSAVTYLAAEGRS
jgi:hypothetical protein